MVVRGLKSGREGDVNAKKRGINGVPCYEVVERGCWRKQKKNGQEIKKTVSNKLRGKATCVTAIGEYAQKGKRHPC